MTAQTQQSTTDDGLRLSALVADHDDVAPPDVGGDDALAGGTCRICGLDGPGYAEDDVFSNAFTSAEDLQSGDHICYRCEHMATQTDYRRYHWIATEDGIETTKDREQLLETLLDPPDGRWMVHATDGFLYIRNSWVKAQALNTSRDHYRVLDDTRMLHIDREEFADMVAFARDLRRRDDAVAKRVLTGGVDAADYGRYDVSRAEAERIDTYVGRGDWELVARLVQ
jgi:hypothetical protein